MDQSIKLSSEAFQVAQHMAGEMGFPTVDDYVEHLISVQELSRVPVSAEHERLVLEALEANTYKPLDEGFWDRLRERVAARKKSRASA